MKSSFVVRARVAVAWEYETSDGRVIQGIFDTQERPSASVEMETLFYDPDPWGPLDFTSSVRGYKFTLEGPFKGVVRDVTDERAGSQEQDLEGLTPANPALEPGGK